MRYRFDLDSDLTDFCRDFAADDALAGPLERIGGMRTGTPFSLYEWLCTLTLLDCTSAAKGTASGLAHRLLRRQPPARGPRPRPRHVRSGPILPYRAEHL
nr:hypothetical protein [Streptomyces roseoverticillatus]